MRRMHAIPVAMLAVISACSSTPTTKVPMICEDHAGSSLQTLGGAALGGAGAAYAAHRFIGKGNGKLAATAGAGLIGAILGGMLAAPEQKCYPDPRYLSPAGPQTASPVSSQTQAPAPGLPSVIEPGNADQRISLVEDFITQINLPDQETVQSINVGNRDIVDIQFHYNNISIKATERFGTTNMIVHSTTTNNTRISRQFILIIKPSILLSNVTQF